MGIGRRKKGDLMQSSQCAFHRRSLPVNSLPARADGCLGLMCLLWNGELQCIIFCCVIILGIMVWLDGTKPSSKWISRRVEYPAYGHPNSYRYSY